MTGITLTLAIACLSALIAIKEPMLLKRIQHAQFDQYQKLKPRDYHPLPVKIIDIDEQSLKQIGQWPWDRATLAKLVNRLESAQVAAIAFDMIFSESDRTSPKSIAKTWQTPNTLRSSILSLPDHDEVFAQSLKKSPSVLGFSLEESSEANKPPKKTFNLITMGGGDAAPLPRFYNNTHSLDILESSIKGSGAISYMPDEDGVIRKIPLLIQLGDTPYPSLVTEALRVAQKTKNYVIKISPTAHGGMEGLVIGKLKIPSTPDGQLWVYFSPHQNERFLPAYQILNSDEPIKNLQGAIVLIGSSAKGLMDQRHTPLGEITPGVEIHAQVIEQALSGTFLARPPSSLTYELVMIIFGTLMVGLITLRAPIMISALALMAIALGTTFFSWHAFSKQGQLIDISLPNLTYLVTFLATGVSRHFSVERQQKWIKEAFSRYVSPNLVTHLVENPNSLTLGGETRTCSFIFTDLAGFTSLIEKIKPEAAVAYLNDYLDQMIAIAFKHDGTLDRIVGDAVAIMFSAPVTQADHAERAYQCALEMLAFSESYARALQQQGIAFGETRIGVHTGEVVVGNFGGTTIFDYRALGDTVNTAARLESVNKQLGTKLCVSEATILACAGAKVLPVGELILKGKSQAIKVYTPMETGTTFAPQEAYLEAYQLMASQKPAALKTFKKLSQQYPSDPLVTLHASRLENGETGALMTMSAK